MRNKLFSLTLLILLILGIGIFIKPQKEISIKEKRTLANTNEMVIKNGIKDIEDIMKDQFYFRDFINENYYQIDTALARRLNSYNSTNNMGISSYAVLNDEISVIDRDYLIYNTFLYDSNSSKQVASRGYNINQLASKYPNIKTYVYMPTRIEENMDYYDGLNQGQKYRQDFIRELGPLVKYDYLRINNVEEYKKMFYKSDNHWNIFGAYEGYKDIINMIRSDFKIDEPRKYKDVIKYDHEFRGNLSAKIGGIGSTDNIYDLVFDNIGEYDYYVDGVKTDLNLAKENYRKYGNETEFYDYGIYFGSNEFIKEFDFHQEDKPNLLIFSDSYVSSNNYMIASHFNKTISIDLRAKPDDFDLDYYIEKYDIDAFLVHFVYWDLYFNGYMYIPVE